MNYFNEQTYTLDLGIEVTIRTRQWYDMPSRWMSGTEDMYRQIDFRSVVSINGKEIEGYGLSETASLHNLSEKIKLYKELQDINK